MSSCSCVYVGNYLSNSSTCFEMRVSKKIHQCGECMRDIQKSEEYERSVVFYDGSASTYKTCLDCLSIRNEFFCNAWMFTTIWDDLKCHIRTLNGEISSKCIMELTKKARDRVCDMIEECWNEK